MKKMLLCFPPGATNPAQDRRRHYIFLFSDYYRYMAFINLFIPQGIDRIGGGSLEGSILAGIHIANLISHLRIQEWIGRHVLRKKNHKNE